jgi:CheY-like chemotaxis protein
MAFSLAVVPAPAPEPPLPTVPPPAADAVPIVPQPIDPTLGRRLPLRILVAEDDEVSRQVLLRALEKMGYAADTAADGEAAIERIKRSGYDLVFMDIHMPRLDGLAATRRIAEELPEAARPYIVATTASVMQNARRQCLDAGMDDYLAKPLRVRQLQDAIVRAAEGRSAIGRADR